MKTSLYNQHVKLDSKLVDFAGFDMPVSYPAGINKESAAVRKNVGVFDVSHMGQILIKGDKAFEFVQYLTTNDVSLLNEGDCQYTLLCNEDGGIIDDFILYCLDDGYLLVVNASNIDKDFNWIENNIIDGVSIENLSDNISLIALQGPNSRDILSGIKGFKNIVSDLKFYKFRKYNNNQTGIISRTGYTGELGYEIYGEHDFINDLWSELTLGGFSGVDTFVARCHRDRLGYGHKTPPSQQCLKDLVLFTSPRESHIIMYAHILLSALPAARLAGSTQEYLRTVVENVRQHLSPEE